MRKILLTLLIAMLSVGSYAARGEADTLSASNIISVEVLPTKDLTKVPVQVSLTNSVPITCVQCYLGMPDSADVFLRESDKLVTYTPSQRWNANHQALLVWNTKKYPGKLMAMVISTRSEDFKENSGPIITVYIDASKLGNGNHRLLMTKANVVWTDTKTTKTYDTPDAEIPFVIKNDEVVEPDSM
ncbi:MAG: hypothetical protein IKN51_01910 [Bacteroidaceae bacterium]|nr:hypothetical protein [Bacteroidaceae bacterium]MBR3633270.1 hypothetical protein [Bacteroidaceae bacterium]